MEHLDVPRILLEPPPSAASSHALFVARAAAAHPATAGPLAAFVHDTVLHGAALALFSGLFAALEFALSAAFDGRFEVFALSALSVATTALWIVFGASFSFRLLRLARPR